jgi:hypothetical protein
MRRRGLVAVLALVAAAAVAPTALARSAEQRFASYELSTICDPAPAVGGLCPASVSATVKTSGYLKFSWVNPRSSDSVPPSNAPLPYDDKVIEFSVDGGAWTGSATVLAPSTSPQLGPDRVAPGTHTITVRVRWVRDGGGRHGFFGTLRVWTTEARIARLELPFNERLEAAKARLRPTVERLAARKTAIENEILAERRRGDAAVARMRASDQRVRELTNDYLRTRRTLARLVTTTPNIAEAGQGFVQALQQVGNRIAAVERDIVLAVRNGRNPAALNRQLADLRGQIVRLDRGLEERRPAANRDLRTRWKTALRDQAEAMHAQRVAEADADYERQQAETEIRRLLDERATLDREAIEIGAALASLDFDVREITVRAGGEVVYAATGSREDYQRIVELDARLAEAKQALDAIEPVREDIRQSFYRAQKDVIAAEALLAGRIMSAATWRAINEGVFYLWDVGSAFARGGPIAALTQATQKLMEGILSGAILADQGVQGDEVRREIEEEWHRGFTDTLSAGKLGRLVGERVVKETVIKAGRDTLNKWIAEVTLGPFGQPLPAASPSPFSKPLPSAADVRKWLQAPRQFGATEKNIENLRRGFRLNRGSLGGLTEGILRDLGKTFFRTAINEFERAAWVDFIEKDLIARARYPIYRLTTQYYWDAYDGYEALLHAKTRLIDSARDAGTAYRVDVSRPLPPDAQLEISLGMVVRSAESPPPVVSIAGTNATLVSRSADGTRATYRIAASALDTGTDGLATLSLR